MTERPLTTFFEVYPNRCVLDGILDVPLIHRANGREAAMVEARRWGACVYKVTCHVITEQPMNREVITATCVYAWRAPNSPDPVEGMDRRALKRQLGFKRWSRPPRKR